MFNKYLLCLVTAVAVSFEAGAGIAYYWNKSQVPAEITSGEADTESALFAQFAGTTQDIGGRQVPAFAANGGQSSLLWHFVRPEGDTTPYAINVEAQVYMEPGQGKLELHAGYDEYYGEMRNDSYFATIDPASVKLAEYSGSGTATLKNDQLLVMPGELKDFMVILTVPTAQTGGLAGRVEKMTVRFTEIPPPQPGELLECPYWAAPLGLTHDVLAYGADPTGEKDSAPAFQRALDQGGEIRVPAGLYRIDSTLLIRKSHTYLIGEGRPELRRERNAGDYTMIANVMVPGVRQMSDILIDGFALKVPDWRIPDLGNPSAAISLSGVRDAVVRNCMISFPAHEGIRSYCGDRVTIQGNHTYGARHGITVGGNYRGYQCFDSLITGNQVHYGWDTGIVVGIQTNRTVVTGNLVAESGCHAIDIFNCKDVTVSGNIIRNWLDPVVNFYESNGFKQAVGIFIHTDWGIIRDIPTENVTVSGNTLICDYDFVLPPGQQPGTEKEQAEVYFSPVGIQVTGDLVRNVTVTGNTVTGGAKGFYLTSLEPFGHGPHGEILDGTPQNVTCVGNTFSGQKYSGIEVESRIIPIRALIRNNMVAGDPVVRGTVSPGAQVSLEGNMLGDK